MRLIVALGLLLPTLGQAATRYVAVTGTDGPGCGAKTSPCRSIGQGIANAADGDSVTVGPGTYGDLNHDSVLGAPGEENPALFSPGCSCMVALNKAVKLTSSAGAAATVIDARNVSQATNVLVIAGAGGQLGKPGKGFTVTNTMASSGNGIVVDASQVAIAGNQVVGDGSGAGITTVDAAETILIAGNQVIGWELGIDVTNVGKTVTKNQVSRNTVGIRAVGTATGGPKISGNVATGNTIAGISVAFGASAIGNAAYGNGWGVANFIDVLGPFGGPPNPTIVENNLFANQCGLGNFLAGQDAADNYWGAASGPGSYPADDVCNLVPGATATATPFATTPFKVRAPIRP